MGGVEELYREVILDHFKAPRNKGRIDRPDSEADGVNPLCGDQIKITSLLDDTLIKDVKFEGHGCAISQSSASMMTAAVKGKTISEAIELTQRFKHILGVEGGTPHTNGSVDMDELGDLAALEGVKKYPVRIKCALLAWNTLLQNLEQRLKS